MFKKNLSHDEIRRRVELWEKIEPYLLWGFAVIGVLVIGALLAREQISSLRSGRHAQTPQVATVNGEKVSVEEYQRALGDQAGQAVLEKIILEKLILQEAERRGVGVSLSDVELPEAAKDAPKQDQLRKDLRVATSLRNAILTEIKEEEVREVFELFRPELTQYDLRIGVDGVEQEKLIENFTLPVMERRFGTEATARILQLKDGKSVEVSSAQGKMKVRLVEVRDSFEELKKSAEDILVDSRKTTFIHALTSGAEIQSPFVDASPAPSKVTKPDA